jgi:D-amino-acid dehydrogenase
MKKVVIIGSGAIAVSTAYFLSKKGLEVQIITAEKEGSEEGCSYGNAGMIVPSHFTPLAAPGVIKNGLKWMFDPQSPLYIKPQLNADFISWIWKFINSANARNVERSTSLLLNLNSLSRDLFKSIEMEEEMNYHFEKGGLMMMYRSKQHQDEEERMAEKAMSMGLEVAILDHQEMQEHEKSLASNVLGGVWYKSDAHIVPALFMKQMGHYLVEQGVEIVYDAAVRSFEKRDGKIVTINTDKGKYSGDEIVICAGAWSQKLSKELEINLPIQGGKGYHLHISDVPLQLKTPSILCEAKIAMTPMQNDLRISGTMEISGLNLTINQRRVEGIKNKIEDYFENFNSDWFEKKSIWAGLRPVSPDGLPYIGRSSAYSNLSYNTGHAMMGLSLAPISGKIVSDILAEGNSEFDLAIFNPDRFS